jgi:hypothetical protein
MSSSTSNSGSGASKTPSSQALSQADHGLTAGHLHSRTFGSDSSSSHHQEQGGEALRCQGDGSSSSNNGSIQGQLQLLRAHHAGLMRLGLLMALTM